jgi:hypothetical protein
MEKSGPLPAAPCPGAHGYRRYFDANPDSRHCLGEDLVAWYSWEEVFGSAEQAPGARECSQIAVLVTDAQN